MPKPNSNVDDEIEEALVRFASQYSVFAHAVHIDNNEPYPCLEKVKALIATQVAEARVDELTTIFNKQPFDEPDTIADVKRMSWGEPPLETLNRYLTNRIAHLTGGHNA